MWARVARFEGEPADVDARIGRVRGVVEGNAPAELAGAEVLLLADRESGRLLSVVLFESEEAMQRGDAAMNAGAGHAGARRGVEFYEVALRASL